MKNLVLSLCFFGLAGYLAAILIGKIGDKDFEDYIQQLIQPPEERYEGFSMSPSPEDEVDEELELLRQENPYPVKIRVKNMDGQTLNIRLTGRSESNISFTREGDGRRFIYAIHDLDSASRKKVRKYPALGIAKASEFLNKGLSLDEVHAEQLRLRAERLSQLMRETQADASVSNSEVERRSLQREYEKYRAERLEILKDLSQRRSSE